MPYTLAKWIVWLLLAALVGGIIGYLLRSLRGDHAAAAPARPATPDPAVARAAERTAADAEELTRLRAEATQRDAHFDLLVAERDQLRSELNDCRSQSTLTGVHGVAAIAVAPALSDEAIAEGAVVLGRPLRRDDLSVVEGIGPKISELIQASGVTTWWGLANADVGSLRATLEAGGPTFRIHDPGTWPMQAELLANGSWAEFKELTDRLDGGRA